MNNVMNYLLLFLCVFAANALLTKGLIGVLSYFGIVDVPEARRAHSKITPRGGGLAIILVTSVALISFEYFFTHRLTDSMKLTPLLAFVSIISFLDDLKHIPEIIRLSVHIICATLAVYFFVNPFFLAFNILPPYIIIVLLMLALTSFINIYNFMDGIDGITCLQSVHLSVTALLLLYFDVHAIHNSYLVITLSVIILACSMSFLLFNWHPASIFLGDVGSIGLGFLTGICLLLIASSSLHLLLSCIIATLYHVSDAVLTICIRLYHREKIWKPHLEHFFQKAIRNGKSQTEVLLYIGICNTFLMTLAIAALSFPIVSLMIAILVVSLTLARLHETN